MVPLPIAVGLSLCDYILVEEGTRKVSLIGTLTRLEADGFPYIPRLFFVYAVLLEGVGAARIKLVVRRLDTNEEIYERERQVHFSNRLQELHISFRVERCSFPVPGRYELDLLVDGESVTRRCLRIVPQEE